MIVDTKLFSKIKPCLFYSQLYDSSFYMNVHAHNTLEVMYVTRGKMNFITVDANKKENLEIVNQGEFVIIKSNFPHKISFSSKETHVLNLEFESLDTYKNINELFFSNPYSNQYVKGKKKLKESNGSIILIDNGDVFQTINRIHKLLASSMSIETFETQYTLLISQFISDILSCAEESQNIVKGNLFIKKAIAFIESNYQNDISVDDVANEVGCSKTYIEKLFLSEYKISVAKKINETRIKKAKIYLRNLPISPEEVAYAVGFSNYQSFINNFKEVTGQKPASFSKNMALQYQVIHAYKKSFFDITFNKIFSSTEGVGVINSNIEDVLANNSINTFILNDITCLKDNDLTKELINCNKSFFININSIKNNINIVDNINKEIINNDLFDLFLGLYIPLDNNPSNLYSIIDEIHQIIPYARIIVDLEGYETSDKKKLVSETYVTDILDKDDQFNIHYHKEVNKWIKEYINDIKDIDRNIVSDTNYEGKLYFIESK